MLFKKIDGPGGRWEFLSSHLQISHHTAVEQGNRMYSAQAEAHRTYGESQLVPVTFLLGGLGLSGNVVTAAGAWGLVEPEYAGMSEEQQYARFRAVYLVAGIQSPFSLTDALGPESGRPEPASWWPVEEAAALLNRTPQTVLRLCREGHLERRGESGSIEVSGRSLYLYHHDPASLVRVNVARPARAPGGHTSGPHVVASQLHAHDPTVVPSQPLPGNTPRPQEQFGQAQGHPVFLEERTP